MKTGVRVSAVTLLVGIVMLLVPALAYMQYQWLGQLSLAERERMQRTLRTAAAQFATEFDGELSRALVSLQVDGPTLREGNSESGNWGAYAQRYVKWTTNASEPRLVQDVFLVDTIPGTDLNAFDLGSGVPADRMRLRRWNNQSLAFEAAEWTPDLLEFRGPLATHFIGLQMDRPERRGGPGGRSQDEFRSAFSFRVNNDDLLVSPVTTIEFSDVRRGPPRVTVLGFTIVRLNRAVIRDSILAALTAQHFQAHGEDYRVAVVRRDEPAAVVWESEPGVAKIIEQAPDVTHSFMAARPDQMFVFARGPEGGLPVPAPPGGPRGDPPPAPERPREGGPGPRIPGQGTATIRSSGQNNIIVSMIEKEERSTGTPRVITRSGQLNPFEGRWVVMAKHRAGSLEAAVAAARQRNLVISSSVLLLLTMAVGLIVVSARRAQYLARQQMEFVAAVSHELRTPVSVIGAAAGNLADGVVGDPQRVRKYGETIQGEARRLAETVERVLQLAGIAAGRAAAAQVPVHAADLVRESLDACRLEIEAAGFTVETQIADDLPAVLGDVTALRSALQNLISNGVKYGGPAKWIRVSAKSGEPAAFETVVQARGHRLGRGAGTVSFTVEDRGLGIDAEDRKHIFEPFYRGREAVQQQIQGSGLGLNLVARIAEAHGGRVTLSSTPGKGSAFTLSLPAATDHAASEAVVEPGLQTRPT